MSHYYDHDGNLVAYVPNASKPGTMRPTTSADARKLGLVPSVTTILSSTLPKPGLVKWQIGEAVKVALEMVLEDHHDRGEAVQRAIAESQLQVDEASDWGHELHGAVSAAVAGVPWIGRLEIKETADSFMSYLDLMGIVVTKSEYSFVNHLYGYAGTVDLLAEFNGETIIADIKTQEFDILALRSRNNPTGYQLRDPDYPLQLAGYALGIGQPDLPRWSFIVSRTVPGMVAAHKWERPSDYVLWLQLVRVFQLMKGEE